MSGAPYDPSARAPVPAPQPPSLPVPHFRPVWTYVFLAVNILVWLMVSFTSDGGPGEAIAGFMEKDNALIAQGQYWRLLTSAFLHYDLIHIGSNMLFLYVIGPQVEIPFGPRRFLVLYLISGLMGSALSYLLTPANSVGASGALFGVLAALVTYLVRNRQGFGEYGRRRLANLLFVIGINVVTTLGVPRIDIWGHAGGFLGGLALGWALTPVYRVDRDTLWGMPQVVDAGSPRLRWVITAAVALALLFVVAAGTLRWS